MSRTHTQVIYNRLNHLPTPDELKYRQGKATVVAAQTTPPNVDIVDSLVEAVNTSGNATPIAHAVSNPSDGKLTRHDQLYTKQVRNRWTREIIGTYDRVYNWTKRSITYLTRETLVVDGVRYDLNPDVGTLNGRPSDTSDGSGPVNRSKTIHFPFDVEVYDPDQPGDMLGPAIDYTVTFVTWDGQVISTQLVKPGGSAIAPSPPVRPGNTFVGWSEDYINVQRDMIIRPIYSNDDMTVTWLNWDGTVMKTETVRFSQSATPPPEPSRIGHVFSGWDVDYTYIVADTTITAVFSPNILIVKFLDWDDWVLGEVEVPYGESAPLIMDPIRENYNFIGWDYDLTVVTEDIITRARYEIKTFNVSYYDTVADKLISSEEVPYGEKGTPPTFPWYHYPLPDGEGRAEVEEMNRELDRFYDRYNFIGWDMNVDFVDAPLSVNSVFEFKLIAVTICDGFTGEVLSKYETSYGSTFIPIAVPDHKDVGREFNGWKSSNDLKNMTEDTTVYANYTIRWLTITYLKEDGMMSVPPRVHFEDRVRWGNSSEDETLLPMIMRNNDGTMITDYWQYINPATGRMEVFTNETKVYDDTICYPIFRPLVEGEEGYIGQ